MEDDKRLTPKDIKNKLWYNHSLLLGNHSVTVGNVEQSRLNALSIIEYIEALEKQITDLEAKLNEPPQA